MNTKICIIGASIIGISTAYRIQENYPDFDVTVISKDFTPNTTSDGAAGLWEPFYPGDTSIELLHRWSKQTYDKLFELMKTDSESGKYGIMAMYGFNLFEKESFEEPFWNDIPLDFHVLKDRELSRFPEKFKSGFAFTTVFMEGSKIIPWFTKKFLEKNGKIIKQEVQSLSELYQDYDVIINCSGLGSRSLINDKEIYPIRGHVLKVKAPWVSEFYMHSEAKDGRVTYILPNQDYVILGGTGYPNQWDTTPTDEDRKWILESTENILPSLGGAEFIGEWVGLRPARSKMRVEPEIVNYGENKTAKIIHNYGHGGCGLTVFWGCAGDVLCLLEDILKKSVETKF